MSALKKDTTITIHYEPQQNNILGTLWFIILIVSIDIYFIHLHLYSEPSFILKIATAIFLASSPLVLYFFAKGILDSLREHDLKKKPEKREKLLEITSDQLIFFNLCTYNLRDIKQFKIFPSRKYRPAFFFIITDSKYLPVKYHATLKIFLSVSKNYIPQIKGGKTYTLPSYRQLYYKNTIINELNVQKIIESEQTFSAKTK